MTRYEIQEGYEEGDKVWVLGLDYYMGGDGSPSLNPILLRGSSSSYFYPQPYNIKREGTIIKRNKYVTIDKNKKGKEQKCYSVEIHCFDIIRNVSESLLKPRRD